MVSSSTMVTLLAALFMANAGTSASFGSDFVAAANQGKEPFAAYLKANFARNDTGFFARLEGFRQQAAPMVYLRAGFKNAQLERHLVEDKAKEKLTLTLYTTGGDFPKIAGVMLEGEGMIDKAPAKTYNTWRDLQSLIDEIRKDSGVPAAGLAVFYKGKEEAFVSGVRRVGSDVLVGKDEIWQMGSIGKAMTATLIARLVEKGKLEWSTTLAEALPGFEMKPGYKDVTIAQLLRHRGGIPRDMNFTAQRVQEIAKGEKDPRKLRRQYALDILGREPISRPGESFAYSNAGYALAGVIAELAMDKTYEELMRQEVFDPLGMTTATADSRALTKDRPFGHLETESGPRPHEISDELPLFISPAGGISCSVFDLAKFGKAHMDGLAGRSTFLKKESFAELHRGELEDEGGPLYACGWSIGPLSGSEIRHGHNGSNGSFVSELAFFPGQDLVVASVVNRGGEMDPSPPLQAVLALAKRYATRR